MTTRTEINDLGQTPAVRVSERESHVSRGGLTLSFLRALASHGTTTSPGASDEDN